MLTLVFDNMWTWIVNTVIALALVSAGVLVVSLLIVWIFAKMNSER